ILSALLIGLGCGHGGSNVTDRTTLSEDDVAGVVLPGDPSKITEVEYQPRATFGHSLTAAGLAYGGDVGNLSGDELAAINRGLAIFTAPRFDAIDGQGPFFNQFNCLGCHMTVPPGGVTTPTPVSRALTKDSFLVFCDIDALPGGELLFPDTLTAFGGPTLHKRSLVGYPPKSLPPLPASNLVRSIGLRNAPSYIGRGLMEAVFDQDILDNRMPSIGGLKDANGADITPIENRNSERLQISAGSSVVRLARFGLRAGGPTMIQFALGNNPAGLNSPFSPGLNTPTPIGSKKPPDSALTTDDLRNIRTLIRSMAPPARVPIVPGSAEDRGRTLFGALNYDDLNNVSNVGDPLQRRGLMAVADRDATNSAAPGRLNCAGCHTPIQITGSSPAERNGGVMGRHLSNKRAFLFSDLLIHAMGHGLASTRFNLGPASDPLSLASYVADANILLPSQSPQLVTARNLGLDQYEINPHFFPNHDGLFATPEDATMIDQGRASPFTWRTATLMGVSLTGPPYLHDARVLQGQPVESALRQAIIYHALRRFVTPAELDAVTSPSDALLDPQSEAYLAVRNFLALPDTGINSKADVIAYLKTL
ncbi:MAG TPA: di-heme oxidoredictase family protein, partial [Chthonomonadaceae bacterium]|nr:di-heme oxidoredictase family protein [Chthonomonadaceae bacterium]